MIPLCSRPRKRKIRTASVVLVCPLTCLRSLLVSSCDLVRGCLSVFLPSLRIRKSQANPHLQWWGHPLRERAVDSRVWRSSLFSPCLSSEGFSRVRSFDHFSLAKSISNRREVTSQVFCSCKEDFSGIFSEGFWWDIEGVVCCWFCSCCLNLPGGWGLGGKKNKKKRWRWWWQGRRKRG
jgi:hypothetical protein